MTLQEKKERLLREIMDECYALCDECIFAGDCDGRCPVNDEAKTAILSLDKKENWPWLF